MIFECDKFNPMIQYKNAKILRLCKTMSKIFKYNNMPLENFKNLCLLFKKRHLVNYWPVK